MKTISVIIPTYNRAHCISDSINSALSQEGNGIDFEIEEVLIIDDCSTDNTEQVVNDINNPIVKYLRMSQNGGPAVARNYGVNKASSEWIAFLDSDDTWHTNKLKKQMEYAVSHSEYKLIYCKTRTVFYDGRIIDMPHPDEAIENLEGNILHSLLVRNCIDTPTMFVSKDAFLSVGGFSENLRALEDWEFAIKFSKEYSIGFVNEILMDSTMLEGGVSTNIANYYESRCKIIAMHKKDLDKHEYFNQVTTDLLTRAKERGIMEEVGKMLAYYIQLYS